MPEDEDGAWYRADLLVAPGASTRRRPSSCAAARVAYNGDDSLSGWVLPRHALRELGIDPDAYDWVRTGSHHNSLRALLRGEVEGAPIDSTVLALELRADPRARSAARIARLGRMPSPPVALVGGDPALAASLRAALTALDGKRRWARGARARRGAALRRAVGDADYAPVRAADADALRLPAVAAQARDHAHALERDRRRPSWTAPAVRSRNVNGQLDDAQPGAVRALRRLDLEDVALRARRGDVDRR